MGGEVVPKSVIDKGSQREREREREFTIYYSMVFFSHPLFNQICTKRAKLWLIWGDLLLDVGISNYYFVYYCGDT